METETGKSLTPILTEDSSCPVHAPMINRALHNLKGTAEAIKFYASQRYLDSLEEWERAYKYATCMNHIYAEQFIQYTLEMLTYARKRREEANAKLSAQHKLARDLGPREFTLTYSPTWFDAEEAKRTMTQAIERLTRYYKHEIIEFHAIGEYTSSGNPHIHAFYLLAGGRKITDKNFKRAYPRWNPKKKLGRGFEGGHHETVDRISDFAGYTEKHLDEAWLNIHISNGAPEIINPSPSSQSSQEDDA